MTYNNKKKADIINETTKTVSREAYNFAKENGILYFETSSFWSRNQGNNLNKPHAKGIENIVLDLVESNINLIFFVLKMNKALQ